MAVAELHVTMEAQSLPNFVAIAGALKTLKLLLNVKEKGLEILLERIQRMSIAFVKFREME